MPSGPTSSSRPTTLAPVQVTASLDRARSALSPDTGTSQTVFDRKSILQSDIGKLDTGLALINPFDRSY